VYIIDSIEGNSNIGVPVFSRFGQKQNYQFITLSPIKEFKIKQPKVEDPIVAQENEKFKIEDPFAPVVGTKEEVEKNQNKILNDEQIDKKTFILDVMVSPAEFV
jgi:hypothetical protein